MKINVILNGSDKQFPEEYTLFDIMKELGLNDRKIVAEVDGTVIMPDNFAALRLKEGSRVEFIKIVGGG